MRYGELPALHTKDKCVCTVHVCVQLLMKMETKRDWESAGWPASLSREALPLINNQGQT